MPNETYSDIAERELGEAEKIDRESRDDEESGDRLNYLLGLGYHLEDSGTDGYVSRERVVVHYPNGYDDVEEEVEDEYEISELED